MGCNSSKHKHTALPEPHNGVHEPVHAEHRASVGAEHKAHVNRYDEQLDYDALQEPEMEQGVEVVTHQKWSGANYVDQLLMMVQGGVSSTSAMGKGVTEDQFKKK